MKEAQEREEHFLEEEKYLDKPVDVPMRKVTSPKDNKEYDKAVANFFLRPPKGIDSKPKPEARDGLLWQYATKERGGDFTFVEMAFAEDENGFTDQILNSYPMEGQPNPGIRQITRFGEETTIEFDNWEFKSGGTGYSINILKGRTKPIVIVYIYSKARFESAQKAIELSLQTLALDNQVVTSIQRYKQHHPWQLVPKPSP